MFAELESFVNAVGFPIAAFLLMFYSNHVTMKENTKALSDLKSAIRDMKTCLKK